MGTSRRQVLKTGAAGAALAWSAPAVIHADRAFGAPANGTPPPARCPTCATCGQELVVNGDAENGTTGWTTSGAFETVAYGAGSGFPTATDPGPPGASRGTSFFGGGNSASSGGTQVADVSGAATAIDAACVQYTLSGWLGGFDAQEDNATFTATFLAAGSGVLGSATIGPVTAADRSSATGLLFRSTAGAVPAGTRSIQLAVTQTRAAGTYDDGYADNLSLVLSG